MLKEIVVKHAKALLHEVNDTVIPQALDSLKARIPGVVDDVMIEAAKPAVKAFLAEKIEELG